ncbi:Plectin [Aphelenchoides fujianensis]|nr:Plectin [Aphelenchoides fujianensis]
MSRKLRRHEPPDAALAWPSTEDFLNGNHIYDTPLPAGHHYANGDGLRINGNGGYATPSFATIYGPPTTRNGTSGAHSNGYVSDFSSDMSVSHADTAESESLIHYENNLERHKDERDRIQKKTFTKWINKHLGKSGRNVDDLFVDLQNGRNLIALLESLTSETLPKEHGETRFHRTQNVQACLDFLARRHIKLRRKEEAAQRKKLVTTQRTETRTSTTRTNGVEVQSVSSFEFDSVASSQTEAARAAAVGRAVMYKVLRSYSRKSERKHDATGQPPHHTSEYSHFHTTNGHGPRDGGPFVTSPPPSIRNGGTHSLRRGSRERDLHHEGTYSSEFRHGSAAGEHRNGHVVHHDTHRSSSREGGGARYYDTAFSSRSGGGRGHYDQRSEHHQLQRHSARGQGYSESSSYETREHFERKVQRTKKKKAANGDLTVRAIKSTSEWDDLAARIRRLIGVINEKLDRILERIEHVERRVDTEEPRVLLHEIKTIVHDLDDLGPPIKDLYEDVQLLKQRNHPEADDLHREVLGLEQRRQAYLDRINNVLLPRINARLDGQRNRGNAVRQAGRGPEDELNSMRFVENLETLEEMFEKHKVDNRDIQDFRQTVDECIARQAEVSVDESHEYCTLLSRLESTYQQLRDLSAGRMLDLDSLIAFIRAAQQELVWIHERETIEVARNWSDINQLDLPMLQNYYKQLLHEIEIRERQFNDVHNQGAALINQRHPASDVIDVYLRSMQNQWDWLLGLSKCLEGHLRDALNVKTFTEEADQIEQWMQRQTEHLEKNYTRTDFTIEEGERYLKELDEIGEFIRKYQSALLSLAERAADISPLWQRGEQITRPMVVTAWCDYVKDGLNIATNDEVTLLNNWDLINWQIRDVAGREGQVPSVVFRIPPPDSRIATYLERLRQQFERLKKLWERKNQLVRYHMILNTMRQVRGWDLETFLNIPPEQRDAIIQAVNDDANRLLSEMDPNDPLAKRLAEELRLTNEHIANLLRQANKPKEPDHSSRFDQLISDLLRKLDEAWRLLNERVGENVPRTLDELERLIHAHKQFEDDLQALDVDVSNVKELFRQIPNPTPTQVANHEHLNNRWEDLWDLSRMYVDRLKALESVLQGLDEVTDIVRRHEITLNSFDDMPAALDRLRGVHAQLLELNMVLKQQQNIVDALNRNVAILRQHVSRTRFNKANHPDVDRLEGQVQEITVRWENVCAQIEERLKSAEEAQQTQMVYRSQYDEEIQWLDRVEHTINNLRQPEKLRPEELQAQLEELIHEYQQLQEHTSIIENINREGGKFIREARTYDIRLGQFHDNVVGIHGPSIRSHFRRSEPQPKNGAQIVTEELEALNRRFAELSSLILERKTLVNTYIENHRRKLQAARRKALDDADRLRREREAAEAERRRREEEDRRRREREADEAARRAREDADRRRREEEERRRREDEERRRREEEEARRRRIPEPKVVTANQLQEGFQQDDYDQFDNIKEVPQRAPMTEHEDEMQRFEEETVTKTQFYEMEGNLHKQTGEILTFVEAIRQGLLDLSSGGEFFDIVSGSRVSLEKAAELGYITSDINEILNGRHGIKHPESGHEITLIEAIRIGLYDPDIRQLRDIKTGEILSNYDKVVDNETQRRLIKMGVLKSPPMSVDTALSSNAIDARTGEFRGKYAKNTLSLREALSNGYVQFARTGPPTIAISLADCIRERFIDAYSGEFIDRNTNEKFTFRDALKKDDPLISSSIREIVNTAKRERITLNEAIVSHAINHREGKFKDLNTQAELSLYDAYERGYIAKPLTLTEAVEKGLLDAAGRFTDEGTNNRYTLIEAIEKGLLDPDARHIIDPTEKDVISIVEALERGLLLAEGQIVLDLDSEGRPSRTIDLRQARHEGILANRYRHSIFDVKGIKNPQTQENLSFNEAVQAGILDVRSERLDGHSLSSARGLIDQTLQEILTSPIGIRDGHDLSLIQAVAEGYIDPTKGVFLDHQREVTPAEAYNSGRISLRGAIRLAGLLDVHPSLIASSKRRDQKRRIRRPGQQGDDQVKITLAEAIKQGLVDSRTQRFRQGTTDMSLDEAVHAGLIDPTKEWINPARAAGAGPTIEEKTQETVTETGQQLAPKIYPDQQLEESVQTVKRVKRTETSAVGGPGGVSVYRAITGGKGAIEVPSDGYHVLEAERLGIIDLKTGVVSPPGTEKTLSLEEAFNLGVLNPRSISFRDSSGRHLNATEALEKGVLDRNGHVKDGSRHLSLSEAIDRHVVRLEPEPPATIGHGSKKVIQFSQGAGPVLSFKPVGQPVIEEHSESWTFDSQTGRLTSDHGESVTLDAALRQGKLAPEDLRVRDALTGREMTFQEAEQWNIVNAREGYYLDKTDNRRYSFAEAAQQHRIYPTGGVPEHAGDAVHTTMRVQTRSEVSKKEAVPVGHGGGHDYNIGRFLTQGHFDEQSGLFRSPDNQKEMTLKELIVKGFLHPYHTKIHDRRRGKEINLLEAIQDNIVDDVAGTVEDTATGRKYNIAQAHREGLIRETAAPQAIEGSHGGRYDLQSGEFEAPGAAGSSHSPRLVEKKLHHTPYASEPKHTSSHPTTNGHSSSFVRNQVAVMEGRGGGPGEKLVDLGGGKNVMVKVVKGQDGIEKGEYVDPNTGMKFTIQLHGDPYVTTSTTKVRSTSQVQSVELVPHAEFVGIDQIKDKRNNRVMSLQEAQRQGLAKVDKKGKQNTKIYSAFRSNIELAVNKGIIDTHGQKISLEDAIRNRIVDIADLKYVHPKTNEPLDLSRAANMGLVDVTLAETLPKGVCNPANGEKISVKRAIELGIINPRTGEVRNPFSNERLTWVDLTKSVYTSITMDGVYDPKKGYSVSVVSALNDGLIDVRSQQYHNPITDDRFSLEDATNKGLIDQETYRAITRPFISDYRTHRQLNLLQAVDAKLLDPRNRTIQLSAEKILPISTAVAEGLVPREIGDRLRRFDKLTFAEAVGKGAVDVAQNTFTDPDTGKQISIEQAVAAGLIDTGSVDLDANERSLAQVIASHNFDESSGRIRDPKTGLNVTFRDAVDRRIVDPDSLLHDLETQKTLTVREAVSQGILDQNGRYVNRQSNQPVPLLQAINQGLVAVIASPMQAAQAVTEAVKRRESEGTRFKFTPADDSAVHRQSQPRVREEETTVFRLTPKRAEPGLSVRVRSNVSDDLRNSRGRSLVDDPLALADLQADFLEGLQKRGVDVEQRVVENPSTMRNVSLREAVETGLLDVQNNEIVHPQTGRHYPLAKAVQMKLVNPEAARHLLDALNISLDDLGQVSPVSAALGGSTSHLAPSPAPIGDDPHLAAAGRGGSGGWTAHREVSWTGRPEELRDPHGHTTSHTDTYVSPDGQTKTTTYTERTHRTYPEY